MFSYRVFDKRHLYVEYNFSGAQNSHIHICHVEDEPGLLLVKEYGTESASFSSFLFIILKLALKILVFYTVIFA